MKSLLIIFLGAVFILFFGIGKKERKSLPWAIGILILALVFIPLDMFAKLPWDFEMKYAPGDMVDFDKWSLGLCGILILGAIMVFGLFANKETMGSDLLGLLMFSLCGAMLMVGYNNLVMLFIGLEALSIPLYVLAGSKKSDLRGNEAAIKYFLMGAFSTAVFLLGCAFIYGSGKYLDLGTIYEMTGDLGHNKAMPSLLGVGISLVLVGLCFKASAFPFHFWSPDVYEGSPVRTTVFMATIVKIAAIGAIFRLFAEALHHVRFESWGTVLAVISACTILVGNIGALRQKSVKRTLAYSGIAQAGYMLMAILASEMELGIRGILLYTAGYAAANAIVFYFFNRLSANGNEEFSAFAGLGKNNRFAGLLVGLGMLSLAGIPLTAGFSGKLQLFSSSFSDYSWLVIIALIGSAISIAYYFRIFKEVFFSTGDAQIRISWMEYILLSIAALMILFVGILPSFWLGFLL